MIAELIRELTRIKLGNEPNKEAASRRAIFYALKNQGGVYVKCLQTMAVTQKFLEGWAGPAEMKVFEQVDAEPVNLAKYIDSAEIATISEQPVGCGSFAVVYRATLATGEEVAVKILRPSIERNLKSDLKKLRMVEKIMGRFLPRMVMDYREAMAEFARTCLLETDYVREVANMEYFQKFYAGHPHVRVPQVYGRLCRKNVIVQEWIEGPTFASVLTDGGAKKATQLTRELTGSDLWTQLIIAGGEAIRMALYADFVFGDPHPGNIKLLPDNKIAIIDFGIIASRPPSRMAFYKWVRAYRDVLMGKSSGVGELTEASIMCFCPDIALALKDCKLGDESAMDKILTGVKQKLATSVKDDATARDLFANGHLFRLFMDVLDNNNALGLRLDMTNFQLLRAMQSYLGSMTVLDNSETRDRFAGAMMAAMNYAVEYTERTGLENDLPMGSQYSRSQNLQILVDTMSSLADGNEFLFNYLMW